MTPSVISPDGTITQTIRSPAGSASTSAASDGDVGDVRVAVVPGDLDARGADALRACCAPILPRPTRPMCMRTPLSSALVGASRHCPASRCRSRASRWRLVSWRSGWAPAGSGTPGCPRRRAISWPVNSTGLFGCVNDSRTNGVLSAPRPSSRNCGLNATEISSPTSVDSMRLGRLRVVALAGVEDDLALAERQPDRGVALGDEGDALGRVGQGVRADDGVDRGLVREEPADGGVVAVDEQARGLPAGRLEADHVDAGARATARRSPSRRCRATSRRRSSVRARTSATRRDVRASTASTSARAARAGSGRSPGA